MAAVKVERRRYSVPLLQLFGICLTALGQMRATVERHDVQQATVVAIFGARALTPTSELSLVLRPLGEGQTELVATWRARTRSGDRRLLAIFLEAVDGLVE